MRGLVGAATIMGCLKYGASFSGLDDQDDPVLLFRSKDEDLLEAPVLPSCKVFDSPWTNVLSLLRWELNTSLMPSAFTHKGPGEQLHAMLLSIPSCHVAEDTHLEHLPVNKFSLTPRRIPVERKASADKSRVDLAMLLVRRVDLRLRVVGLGCLTIPLLIQNAPT